MEAEQRNRVLIDGLLAAATRTDDWDLIRDIADLMSTDKVPADEYLTYSELAGVLGVEPKENGEIDFAKLFNACLSVGKSARVRALPQDERLRVIASATAVLNQ